MHTHVGNCRLRFSSAQRTNLNLMILLMVASATTAQDQHNVISTRASLQRVACLSGALRQAAYHAIDPLLVLTCSFSYTGTQSRVLCTVADRNVCKTTKCSIGCTIVYDYSSGVQAVFCHRMSLCIPYCVIKSLPDPLSPCSKTSDSLCMVSPLANLTVPISKSWYIDLEGQEVLLPFLS